MFEELMNRLTAILLGIEDDVSAEVIEELEDIIESLEKSKCSNGLFCGMDKKWWWHAYLTINLFFGGNIMKQWYHIKATHSTIGVVRFWLHQKNKDDIKKLVIKKGYTDIEWIRQETPPFI